MECRNKLLDRLRSMDKLKQHTLSNQSCLVNDNSTLLCLVSRQWLNLRRQHRRLVNCRIRMATILLDSNPNMAKQHRKCMASHRPNSKGITRCNVMVASLPIARYLLSCWWLVRRLRPEIQLFGQDTLLGSFHSSYCLMGRFVSYASYSRFPTSY
jgi:hypothetical protein